MNYSKKLDPLPQGVLPAAWAIALGAIAPMLDATMVNIAINQLLSDFHTTLGVIQWAITGYVLALAVAVPIAGWLMNRFNGKRVFIAAVAAFGFFSILTGASWNVESFIIFRLLQGFCGGILTPLMSTLLVKTAGPENLGRVISIVTTPMIFGPILGPVLGGFILQITSWRWIFFINVFIVLAALPLMNKFVPEFAPFNQKSRLDMIGIALLSLMSASLIYGITKASTAASFADMSTISWLLMGFLLLGCYIFYDRRQREQTVLPLKLFAHRGFSAAASGTFFANFAIMGPMLILPMFFQNMRHLSAIGAAVALMPQGVGMLVARPFIGSMIDRIGAKYVVLTSLAVALLGTIPLAFITDKTNMIWIALALFIRGMSVGGITLPLTSDAYIGLKDTELPEAGVCINILENLGSSFGTAVIATAVSALIQEVHPAISVSLRGYHAGFLISALVLALVFFPAVFLTNKVKPAAVRTEV